jgi:hypothetical protein
MNFSLSSVLLFIILFASTFALNVKLTVRLKPYPQEPECFYQYLTQNVTVEFEYWLINYSERSVTLDISSSNKKNVIHDENEPKGKYNFITQTDGDYEFCFSSYYETEKLFFSITTDDDLLASKNENKKNLEEADRKLNKLIRAIKRNLISVTRKQQYFTYENNLSINKMINNRNRVDNWSIIAILTMITVGLVQLFTIKSLFKERSYHKKRNITI